MALSSACVPHTVFYSNTPLFLTYILLFSKSFLLLTPLEKECSVEGALICLSNLGGAVSGSDQVCNLVPSSMQAWLF